jgi:RNA polymerase sigma-70 factor, ECF subfamily
VPRTGRWPSGTDEAELIRRAREGEVKAFVDLVRSHERTVFLAALSLVRDRSDAEEVAQEAILEAFKSLSHFRQEEKFGTWLIKVVIRQARIKASKIGSYSSNSTCAEDGVVDVDYKPKSFEEWHEIPVEALAQTDVRASLVKAIDTLPEESRVVLFLRDILHLTIDETASVLDLSRNCVKNRLAHGRLQARDNFALQSWPAAVS